MQNRLCNTYSDIWLGKEETYDGGISGTVGQAKRLEAIKIRNNTGIEGSVEYQVHCQSFGWMDWTMDGDIAGLTGLAKRLEAIRIRLTGQLESNTMSITVCSARPMAG